MATFLAHEDIGGGKESSWWGVLVKLLLLDMDVYQYLNVKTSADCNFHLLKGFCIPLSLLFFV